MFAHMYGTAHCIGMDANQNDQHVTFQVTLMQLKTAIQKPFVLYGRLELNIGNKTLYMDLSILILTEPYNGPHTNRHVGTDM